MGGRQMVERLVARYPDRISMGTRRAAASDGWTELARRIRLGLDYLRFLDPRYASTPHLGDRARERAPRAWSALAESRLAARRRPAAGSARPARSRARAAASSRRSSEFMRAQRPDVVLITPLVDIGSPQLDHFAAARRSGVRTVLPVGSWDHLSSKALLRAGPTA